MNPPRGRRFYGGGGNRPYFYFRRNGRTIPARGDGGSKGSGRGGRGNRRFGEGSTRFRNQPGAPQERNVFLDSSFLRAENYAVPEDISHTVQSFAVEVPGACPGWHLYFPREKFETGFEIAKRIKAVEEHYSRHVDCYDLLDIQRKCHFALQATTVTADEALTKIWPTMWHDFRTNPQRTLATFGAAMHSMVSVAVIDASLSQESCQDVYVARKTRPRKIYVRPYGFTEAKTISQITSAELDTLYCVRGTIAAVGSLEASASWIAYKCPRCGQEQALRQTGFYPSQPYTCKRGDCLAKKGFIEQRSSPFTRILPIQIIRVAERGLQTLLDLEDEAPVTLDIELRHDLVDSAIPGREFVITGVLKMPSLTEEQRSCSKSYTDRVYLKAASVIDGKFVGHSFTERDLEAISMINGEPDSFKLLVHSLAPELHGQEVVKAGVLLSLFGGAGSQLHDESEINVLLVGDPGIGKSHMLQICAKVSEKGSLVSGKRGSSSKNCLTASVQGRSFHSIDTGALLSATNGHCAIDDIDHLASQQDALLQTIQSQIISIPFPSIFATVKTSTTIIASANSMRGHYDHSKLLNENIRINTALLKEFHLVFLLVDKPNKDMDTSLTEHIRALHSGIKKSSKIAVRFAMKPKVNNSMIDSSTDGVVSNDDYYDLGARLKLKFISPMEEEDLDLLPPVLIKKFIVYARQKAKPLLNAETAQALKTFYMELKKEQNYNKLYSIGTSHLEGLIRLTQARARVDFAAEATLAHLRDAICIVRHSIADTSLGDYVDTNPATKATTSQRSMVKKFVEMLEARSSALGRRIFDFEELKEMARRSGTSCGVTNLVDIVNMQGFLLKKGPNIYEVMTD